MVSSEEQSPRLDNAVKYQANDESPLEQNCFSEDSQP